MNNSYIVLKTSELTAKIGNNESEPYLQHFRGIGGVQKAVPFRGKSKEGNRGFNLKNKTFTPLTHIAGYNGIWELSSIQPRRQSLFKPCCWNELRISVRWIIKRRITSS